MNTATSSITAVSGLETHPALNEKCDEPITVEGASPEGRRRMLENGFEPILLIGKRPITKGWNVGEITPENLAQVEESNSGIFNTGLRTGYLSVIDIDVRDDTDSRVISESIEEVLGFSLLHRRGSKGEAICYFNPNPVSKLTICGVPPGETVKQQLVEFLGKGQQIAAYGRHPETGRSFEWPLEILDGCPLETPLNQLTQVSPESLSEAANHISATLEALGYTDVSVSASWHQRTHFGEPESQTGADRKPVDQASVLDALSYIDPGCDILTWIKVGGALKSARWADEQVDACDLFCRWSAGEFEDDGEAPHNFEGRQDCERAWSSLKAEKAGGAKIGSLFYLAHQNGYIPTKYRSDGPGSLEHFCRLMDAGLVSLAGITSPETEDRPLIAKELVARDFPRAVHLWDDFLLKDHPNTIDGDGGVGKTQLLIQLAVAVASGTPLFGHATVQMPVLLILCEDTRGESKYRLVEAAKEACVDLEELPLYTWCRPGEDSTLAIVQDDGQWSQGPFYRALNCMLETIGPCFIGLDTISDIAFLDENKRLPVNTFAKRVLGHICTQHDSTLLVTRHPSKASLSDQSLYSGSTAANAAFRNRLAITSKDSSRELKVVKSNYGLKGQIELFHTGSVFQTRNGMAQHQLDMMEQNAILQVIKKIRLAGGTVVPSHGNGYKPKELVSILKGQHQLTVSPQKIRNHMRTLEFTGQIHWLPSRGGKNASAATYEIGPKPP